MIINKTIKVTVCDIDKTNEANNKCTIHAIDICDLHTFRFIQLNNIDYICCPLCKQLLDQAKVSRPESLSTFLTTIQ